MNLAIIGYGKMGKLYDSNLSVNYIVDIRPISNRVDFNNLDEFIICRQPIDLVIVTTPTPNHFETVRKLLNHKYNVLCEKPLCFSSEEARLLEKIAIKHNLILYQSTLERYNPVIKYVKDYIALSDIKSIESYRFGLRPSWNYPSDPKYDLGIHDVDLWFYLMHRKIPWQVNYGYGKKRREMVIYLKSGEKIVVDLLNKFVFLKKRIIKFDEAGLNNPIVEMVKDLIKKKATMNESWSKEIEILEKTRKGNSIFLL